MAGKTKGGAKNKAKAKKASGSAAAAVPDGKGCRACNFSGEVCCECGEPITGCECDGFQPIACKACAPAAMSAAEHQPEPEEQPAAHDADNQPTPEQLQELMTHETPFSNQPNGPAMAPSIHPQEVSSGDPELEKLVTESVQRRLHRFKTGNRRRHHTKQLTIRVLSGIVKAGEAAAQGGADGFFGRWCRNDLMAWESLMDAAEWAMEELNAREFRRMKRESMAASKSQETAAATS